MSEPKIEERLRQHLARVAEHPAPAKLEDRILERNHRHQRPTTWRSTFMVLVTIVVLTVVFTIIVGHQTTQNVFSNISSGLNTQ